MKLFWSLVVLFSVFSQGYTNWMPCPSDENNVGEYAELTKLSLRLQPNETNHVHCVQIDYNNASTLMQVVHPFGDPNQLTCAYGILSSPDNIYLRLPYLPSEYLTKTSQRNDSEIDTYCHWGYSSYSVVDENLTQILYEERPRLLFQNNMYYCLPNHTRIHQSYKAPQYAWTCTPGDFKNLIITDTFQYNYAGMTNCTYISCKVVYFNQPWKIVQTNESLWSISRAPEKPLPIVESVIVVSDTNISVRLKCIEDSPEDVYYQWFVDVNGTAIAGSGTKNNTLKYSESEPLRNVACSTYKSSPNNPPAEDKWTPLQSYLRTFRIFKNIIEPKGTIRTALLWPIIVFQTNTVIGNVTGLAIATYLNGDVFLTCYRSFIYKGNPPSTILFETSGVKNLLEYDYMTHMGCYAVVIMELPRAKPIQTYYSNP